VLFNEDTHPSARMRLGRPCSWSLIKRSQGACVTPLPRYVVTRTGASVRYSRTMSVSPARGTPTWQFPLTLLSEMIQSSWTSPLIHRDCSAHPLTQVLRSGHSNESSVTNIIVDGYQVCDFWCVSYVESIDELLEHTIGLRDALVLA
jgi:hypothetical protein